MVKRVSKKLPGDSPAVLNLDAKEIETLKREGYYKEGPEKTSLRDDKKIADGEKIADEVLIMRLLTGLPVDGREPQVTSYLTAGSPEEKRARAVLAQQLCDGTLNFIAKEALARALDPDRTSQYVAQTRKIEFREGSSSDWARNRLVIDFITKDLQAQHRAHPERRPKLTSAVHAAKEPFGLNRSQLMEIWKQGDRSSWFYQHERDQLVELVMDFIVKHLQQAQLDGGSAVTPNLEAAIKAAKEQFGLEPGFVFVKE